MQDLYNVYIEDNYKTSPFSVPTLLLGAGDGCHCGTLSSIPGSLRTLEQVWLLSLAMNCSPVELGRTRTKQGNCTCMP